MASLQMALANLQYCASNWFRFVNQKLRGGELIAERIWLSQGIGGHKYDDHDGTSDCEYGCGCSMGRTMSHGPTGVDPFGECPGNPKDSKKLGGNADYDVVVERRIRALSDRAYRAEELAKRLTKKLAEIKKTPKAELLERVEALEAELAEKGKILKEIRSVLLHWNA